MEAVGVVGHILRHGNSSAGLGIAMQGGTGNRLAGATVVIKPQ